jgi:UDP-2,4-diacetamido-2,4,6-trideoxy-beta-L-altropyranose hydrolase
MADTILIRANSSAAIGTGHVMRCLSLAKEAVHRGHQVIFATNPESKVLEKRIAAPGITIHWIEDESDTFSLLREHSVRRAVIDGYMFDGDYQKKFVDAGVFTLAMDDYGHAKTYPAHLILNQNLGADESLYAHKGKHTKLLLGPTYALLREEFREKKPENKIIPKVARQILVTLGGSDPDNRTAHVLRSFSFLENTNLEVTVLVGSENPHAKDVEKLAKSVGFPVRILRNASNMADLMLATDIAIAAAGSTTWEMLCMGVPLLTGVIADNQEAIAAALKRAKLADVIGWCPIL